MLSSSCFFQLSGPRISQEALNNDSRTIWYFIVISVVFLGVVIAYLSLLIMFCKLRQQFKDVTRSSERQGQKIRGKLNGGDDFRSVVVNSLRNVGEKFDAYARMTWSKRSKIKTISLELEVDVSSQLSLLGKYVLSGHLCHTFDSTRPAVNCDIYRHAYRAGTPGRCEKKGGGDFRGRSLLHWWKLESVCKTSAVDRSHNSELKI